MHKHIYKIPYGQMGFIQEYKACLTVYNWVL